MKKKVIFYHDNAPTHAFTVATDFELLSHPLYPLDLALWDFFLFPKSKKLLTDLNLSRMGRLSPL